MIDPVTGLVILGGASVLGGLAQGGFGAQASREQASASRYATRKALEEAQRARNFYEVQAGRANTLIGQGSGNAMNQLRQGYQGGLSSLTAGADAANNTLNIGVNGARRQLGQGYDAAQGALSPLLELQHYGGQVGDYATSGGRLGELLGGDLSREGAYAGFEADPGYQYRLQQGEQAINRAAAARGDRLGGRTLLALQEHGQGLASQEYDNFARRRSALNTLQAQAAGQADQSQLGAAMGLANLGYGAGMQSSELERQLGSGLSGLTMGGANAVAGNQQVLGQQQAQMGTNLGTGLANLYQGAASAQGANLTGVANNYSNLAGAMIPTFANGVQYAGGPAAAWGNAAGGAMNNFGFLGSLALMNGGGANPGFGQTWADIGNAFYR